MSLPNRVPNVPYVPAWSTWPRANKRANVWTYHRHANFSTWRANVPKRMSFSQLRLPEGVQIFRLFFKRFIFFIYLLNMFYIFCIFLIYNLYIYIYIYIYFTYVYKKAYLEKHTSCTPQILVEKHTSWKLITKLLYRSSRLQMFFKLGVLTNFAIFIGKHLCRSLF